MSDWSPLARFAALSVLAILAAAPAASAAPGDLDPSFGSGGIVRLLPSHEDIALRGVASQPDGKIVLAGGDQTTGATIVVRLLENGAFDPSFGAGGIVSLLLGTTGSEARAVLVQPDGRIVVAGEAKGATTYDFSVARLNADGSPDLSFGGGDGNTLVPVGPEGDRVEALALGPGGRILAVGEARYPVNQAGAGIAVLGADGLPDAGYFGGDGVTVFTTAAKNDRGAAAAMLADGRVLFADSNGAGFVLVQLRPVGTPDPAFGGGDGVVEQPAPSAGATPGRGGRVADLAVLADGRIVASGHGFDDVAPEPDQKVAVARFLADGQLDTSFGAGGFFSRQFSDEDDDAQAIVVAPTGKLVIAGPYVASRTPVISEGRAVARLQPDGTLDPAFGPGGFVLSGVTAAFGELFDGAALDPEERLVYVGRAYIGNGNTEVVISRYLGDRQPPVALVPRAAARPNRAPHARMKKVPKRVKAAKLKRFSGTAGDPDGERLRRVQIAVIKVVRGGAKASARRGAKCLVLKNRRARFKRVRPRGAKGQKRCSQRWLAVNGRTRWSFKLKRRLAPGRYVVYARAVDARGLAESAFSRKAGNRYAFRVLASH